MNADAKKTTARRRASLSEHERHDPMLSVIIPAYNEKEHIQEIIREVERVLAGRMYEVIVVDDGSTDETYQMALECSNERVKVVRKKNGGKGSAVKYGFNYSSGEIVAFIDADLEIHPRQIPSLVEHMHKYQADIVVGSKRHPLSRIRYPVHRRFLSFWYQAMVKALFDLNVKDTQSGLKTFRHEVLEKVFPTVHCSGYAFDIELLANANKAGFTIGEVPIEINFNRESSRLGIRDIWYIFHDTLAIFYRLRVK